MSQFTVIEPGVRYRLSDGTDVEFLNKDVAGNVRGVPAEEIISMLVHRLEVYRRPSPPAARFLSLCITDLQCAENWLARWSAEMQKAKREETA